MSACCVYSLYRPAGTPCYVGEGLSNRPEQHLKLARNSSDYLYHRIRDVQNREGPIRVRTLYDGLAKSRATARMLMATSPCPRSSTKCGARNICGGFRR